MSNQIVQAIELAMQYTKETVGISDAALGNIDPRILQQQLLPLKKVQLFH
jgi:hypothetical protein